MAFGFWGAPLIAWTFLGLAALVGFGAPEWLIGGFCVAAVLFNVRPLRQFIVTAPVMKIMKALKFIPKISETERVALEAGVVWVEGDLFSGRPNFKKLMEEPYPDLTAEERAFLSGPVEKLCEAVNDWQIWQSKEIPQEAWNIIKREKFLGMIIPKEYGGLGFSALAHSEVIHKLCTRSVPVGVTVMVPNSLGPAELLIHYGTEAQKKRLLPKLATGEEIPCFALTEPGAGSDAGSIEASGVLFKGSDGKVYVRLNWNKRWITLAAISTTLGLAFKLRDPQNILGRGQDLGITCALIPSHTPGVVLGKRHDPLGVPFWNCPTQGKDVEVLAEDCIVGGLGGAGLGWKMLMECLAAGRGISLPGQNVGGMKLGLRVVTNHAVIRKQFGVSISKFEGVEEPIARIAGIAYAGEAMRRFVLGGLDKGIKPPVITAIAKYWSTELGRKAINDSMDVLGGAAISRGPRNLIAHYYISVPIGITVEGANILTRTLMIFGQGALRAHPFAFKEVNAVEKNDLNGFDRAFWGHIGHVVRNTFRSILLSVSRGWLYWSPVQGSVARYYRKLAWVSASFAILSDIAMAALGGQLKMKEKITGRFADILSWMFIGTAILRRWVAEGKRKEDLPFVHFTMNMALYEIQQAFDGILKNLPVPGLSWFFGGPLLWWSQLNSLASRDTDNHSHKIVSLVTTDGEQRDRFADGIYIPKSSEEALGRLEHAFKVCKRAETAEKKIRKAVHEKVLAKAKGAELYKNALEKGVINKEEHQDLVNSEAVRWQAIQVDEFTQEEYLGHATGSSKGVTPPLHSKRLEA
ncbi:MAG: acyl-CoA dehydrogenase [Oligoflexia bacterium]|nr:acyl-CoA dehydrogenase [Oligoflexia bacterium]